MSKHKLLLVGDEKPLAKALMLKLTDSDFDIDYVDNGTDAYNHILKNKYDLVLLDLVLPGMNGFTVLEKVSKNKIPNPILVFSNLSQEEDIQKVMSMGAIGYLIKSDTSLNELIIYINKFLTSK